MTARKRKHLGRGLFTVLVLALLVLLSAINIELLSEPLEEFFAGDVPFEELVEEIQAGYVSDGFTCKNDFVNLNGFFAALMGRRTLNNTVKLNNGMLSMALDDRDMSDLEGSIIEFAGYLRGMDTPFLYIQIPYKESLDGESFPAGVPSYANKIADGLLSGFQAAGIETLDLRPALSRTQETLERCFYKTDHHWNADGAFTAFGEILTRLDEMFPDADIDLTVAREDQWERHSLDNWLLGSWGRRVGIYFAGTDPLIWYTPEFETEMSCMIPKYGWIYRGDFTTANVREDYTKEKQFFDGSAYLIYIGDDFPLVQHRNANASSPLKLLLVKDSFSLPLQAFLSTAFQEIDVIDPRYFDECGIAEYAALTRPDLVIFAINPDWPGDELDFGVEEALSISAEGSASERVIRGDIKLEAGDSPYNYRAYPLEGNAVYRLSFERVDILAGETEGIGLRLYDQTERTVLQSVMFDIAYCEAADGFRWTFRTPDTEDRLELLFYAGLYGGTEGNGMICRNVTLEKIPIGEE